MGFDVDTCFSWLLWFSHWRIEWFWRWQNHESCPVHCTTWSSSLAEDSSKLFARSPWRSTADGSPKESKEPRATECADVLDVARSFSTPKLDSQLRVVISLTSSLAITFVPFVIRLLSDRFDELQLSLGQTITGENLPYSKFLLVDSSVSYCYQCMWFSATDWRTGNFIFGDVANIMCLMRTNHRFNFRSGVPTQRMPGYFVRLGFAISAYRLQLQSSLK